jgi:ATP/ADP translocase
MAGGLQESAGEDWGRRILRWLNLRPGEIGRTGWMFAFYVLTSIGILWFEATSSGLFLKHFGANYLPYIYLASMVISSIWSVFYTWLQRYVKLQWVIVLVAVLIATPIPLLLFGVQRGTEIPAAVGILGMTLLQSCILGMRLWLQTIYVLSDLNATITANQLFNVREVRRAYPLISSGVLVSDVIAGLTLPFILDQMGLGMAILAAFVMILLGAGILFLLGQFYERYFPQSTTRRKDSTRSESDRRQVAGELSRYRNLLFAFFILAEVVFLLVDFQFMSQLENPALLGLVMSSTVKQRTQDEMIAGFIGQFQGVLGFFELFLQWGLSSRLIDRFGIFPTAAVLPVLVLGLGGVGALAAVFPAGLYDGVSRFLPMISGQLQLQFFIMIGLKFAYELVHFTLLASIGPVLFQPLPDHLRNSIQSVVRGTAEPIATGVVGVALAVIVGVGLDKWLGVQWQTTLFATSVILSGGWLLANLWIRGDYLRLWVIKSARTNFRKSDLVLREFKKDAIEAIGRLRSDADLGSCIELLSRIDPKDAGAVLVPMLPNLKPELQCRVLDVMLHNDEHDSEHLMSIHQILAKATDPQLSATALKYVYLKDKNANFTKLQPYLAPNIAPVIRGTAAALCLERGNVQLKGEATNVLRLMLTSHQKEEKLMGCQALSNLKYLQALQVYMPGLLADPDIEVRTNMLDVIAATRFEKSYSSLIQALYEPPTRSGAATALISLGDEALPLLKRVVDDQRQPDPVRSAVWNILGQVGSSDALEILVSRMNVVWGDDRRNILRALVKVPDDIGIDYTLDRLGRTGIETLIDQELMLMGQCIAGIFDLTVARLQSEEGEMLRRALHSVQSDSIERLFLLMQFLYDPYTVQAAYYNLQSGNLLTMAQGLEILDNQLDIPNKRSVLTLLDRNPDLDKSTKQIREQLKIARQRQNPTQQKQLLAALEKNTRQHQADLKKQLQALSGILAYEEMSPEKRVVQLMDLRHFFSNWVVACCLYLARSNQWSLSRHHVLAGIRNAEGFVREATLLYLQAVHPDAFQNVLPKLRNDPDLLVRTQVRDILKTWGGGKIPFPASDDEMNTAALGDNWG